MKCLYPLAKRFIAGHDFESAKAKIQLLSDQGYKVSVDYLGEISSSLKDCEKAKSQYVEIINFYKNKSIDISVKPSQLGMLINPVVSYENINFLARMAKIRGHTIRLDMEDARVTELTINLALSLNKKYGNVGVAIQANLYRSEEDIKLLIKNGISVRLVKGAYKESKDIAHQAEIDIEGLFFHYAATLYSHRGNKPAIATHDQNLLEDIHDILPDSHYFEYEFLYGIRRDLQELYKNKGYPVRIYVPFGEDWLPYCLRRLKEWKNLKFVIKNIFYETFKR